MPSKIGKYSQREMVPLLTELIDDASAKGASAHRDIARSNLRTLLREGHWNTDYVLNNLAPRRCRYIASLGYPVPSKWAFRESRWSGRD